MFVSVGVYTFILVSFTCFKVNIKINLEDVVWRMKHVSAPWWWGREQVEEGQCGCSPKQDRTVPDLQHLQPKQPFGLSVHLLKQIQSHKTV